MSPTTASPPTMPNFLAAIGTPRVEPRTVDACWDRLHNRRHRCTHPDRRAALPYDVVDHAQWLRWPDGSWAILSQTYRAAEDIAAITEVATTAESTAHVRCGDGPNDYVVDRGCNRVGGIDTTPDVLFARYAYVRCINVGPAPYGAGTVALVIVGRDRPPDWPT